MYPKTIDISLTGHCQLDCAWCWGADHRIGSVHSAKSWNLLLGRFAEIGTSAVVFTGGEPLIAPALPGVLKHAKDNLNMRTTLSTNAILLPLIHKKVLPMVTDLGIPLDGSNSSINNLMRNGKVDNFNKVIESILLVQKQYPDIELTVRTVIARPNLRDVPKILQALIDKGVSLSKIRYKLYQVEPIGPRAAVTNSENWLVSEKECLNAEAEIRKLHPNVSIKLQLYKNTSGRYFQIGPRGNAYGTIIEKDGVPKMVPLGNPIENFEKTLRLTKEKYSCVETH
jgi:MoaA/NifB/PqqE/SkfB family radical SAM enzyme